MKVYMMVTQDKYSLPLDFDTNACRLARRLGLERTAVLKYLSEVKSGRLKTEYPRYVRVEVDEDINESNRDNWLDIMIDTIMKIKIEDNLLKGKGENE